MTTSSGVTFVDACDVDKEDVKEDLASIKERWDQLNYIIAERGQAIQDILAKLGDFNDDVRDTDNGLNRIEDKLRGLEKAPTDSKTLDSIKGLLDDTKGLEKLFGKVQNEGEDLINDADQLGSDASNISDTINNLGDRLGGMKTFLNMKDLVCIQLFLVLLERVFASIFLPLGKSRFVYFKIVIRIMHALCPFFSHVTYICQS